MKYILDNVEYPLVIEKKSNKNTYVRFKNGTIFVTTSYFVSNKQIMNVLDQNQEFLRKCILKMSKKVEREENFFFLGNKYDIIIIDNMAEIDFTNKKIYVSSIDKLNKLLKKETENLFSERLNYNYHLFKEIIPFPDLRIRKMTTRWGVCNRKDKKVTLNSELIKYGIDELDYVIIHELSHFLVFNHSSKFWAVVSKYCPNYKEIRKRLKE